MRTNFLDVEFDRLTKDEVLDRLSSVTSADPFTYLVTPNVDHLVKLDRDLYPGLRPILRDARYCLCDSRVLSRLALLSGIDLPVVPGSDLTAALFDHIIAPGDRIAVVGGDEAMAAALCQRFPHVEFVHCQPPMGLRSDDRALQETADFVTAQKARFTFLAVGFPQQEMVAARAARDPAARGMALCIGASLEFLTEHQKRAPRIVQRLGVEWAWRLAREPRRLWRRYLIEGPAIFGIAWRWRRR